MGRAGGFNYAASQCALHGTSQIDRVRVCVCIGMRALREFWSCQYCLRVWGAIPNSFVQLCLIFPRIVSGVVLLWYHNSIGFLSYMRVHRFVMS